MNFIHEDFMLHSEPAKKLYHMYAEPLPIIDYHCHISPKMIAENTKFKTVTQLFLGGDHYKWRAMRANGIDERYITGDADDHEKFMAWAQTIPQTIGNPLYHWTHLELKRYFGIDDLLSSKTAEAVWAQCNAMLNQDDFSVRSLITRSNVEVICTTDDPLDPLEYHELIADSEFPVRVYPAFRPDKAVNISNNTFLPYMESFNVSSYDALQTKLAQRIEYFHAHGCRLADHALEGIPFAVGNPGAVFDKALHGESISPLEEAIFKTDLLRFCAKEYTKRGWTMQLHIGALRNVNTPMFDHLGPDTGYDAISDLAIAHPLAKLLDHFETSNCLPKMILYTLNPKDNYVLASLAGCFQKAPAAGKIQFGSAWWFNDQKDGMMEQMKVLSNLGLLSRFIGMLTDSRSFVSYPRHEYFRRILCDLIGNWVQCGECSEDYELLGGMVENICHHNAKDFFGF